MKQVCDYHDLESTSNSHSHSHSNNGNSYTDSRGRRRQQHNSKCKPSKSSTPTSLSSGIGDAPSPDTENCRVAENEETRACTSEELVFSPIDPAKLRLYEHWANGCGCSDGVHFAPPNVEYCDSADMRLVAHLRNIYNPRPRPRPSSSEPTDSQSSEPACTCARRSLRDDSSRSTRDTDLHLVDADYEFDTCVIHRHRQHCADRSCRRSSEACDDVTKRIRLYLLALLGLASCCSSTAQAKYSALSPYSEPARSRTRDRNRTRNRARNSISTTASDSEPHLRNVKLATPDKSTVSATGE